MHFFQPYEGVQVKILDLQDKPSETSDIIVDYLVQVVAFCGRNANVILRGVLAVFKICCVNFYVLKTEDDISIISRRNNVNFSLVYCGDTFVEPVKDV